MLSLAQAFLSRPKLLLIDELTLGLAPTIVEKLLEIVRDDPRAGDDDRPRRAVGEHRAQAREARGVPREGRGALLRSDRGAARASGRPPRGVPPRASAGENGTRASASTPAPNAGASPTPEGRRRVVLGRDGVTKHYGGIIAVDAVDLELRQDEILGIIGPNGAGKTTLFDLLTGFSPIDGGTRRCSTASTSPTGRRTRARARGLGRSFQDARLWSSLTVGEAISVAFERTITERSPVHAMFGLPVVGEAERDVKRRGEELIELLGPRRVPRQVRRRAVDRLPPDRGDRDDPRAPSVGAAARRAVVRHRAEGDRGARPAAAPRPRVHGRQPHRRRAQRPADQRPRRPHHRDGPRCA